jgi:hypothetical protein
MHPRIQEVVGVLDTYRTALEQAVRQVPPPLQSTRPAPDRWSVAEVVEHLALVEARVGQLIMAQLAAARANGLGPEVETSPVVPTFNLDALLDRSRALTASEASRPNAALSAEDALAALNERRRTLRDSIIAADGLALSSVIALHPRLGDLNLYQWLLFMAAHEGRHTAQIREVAAAVNQ